MGESFVNIGEILQSLRKYKGMSLADLAEDICTVEELTLIEKNKQVPTIDELFRLANKLNVNLSDFFDFTSADSMSYVSAVSGLIKKFKRDRNYQAIYEIVQREKKNPLFNFPSSKQFLHWHEAICLYYLADSNNRNKQSSISMLIEAIELTNPSKKGLTEQEIEIKMSIALIEKDDQCFEKAITLLKEILDDMEKLPSLSDPQVKLRALFGLAQSLTRIEKYDESLKYCEKGIQQCINDEILYLLGEFLYQAGLNYKHIGKIELSRETLNKSLQVFKLQEKENLTKLVEKELEKIPS
ncbi:helix-turn-helix domain-containing protein [Lederbergia graminis]|uniref:Helix-turn-helix domain-containing protein n=1 Tax=Lederbergia graminis TaxID=735518 RepID=A0ABW0LGF4_9BACI